MSTPLLHCDNRTFTSTYFPVRSCNETLSGLSSEETTQWCASSFNNADQNCCQCAIVPECPSQYYTWTEDKWAIFDVYRCKGDPSGGFAAAGSLNLVQDCSSVSNSNFTELLCSAVAIGCCECSEQGDSYQGSGEGSGEGSGSEPANYTEFCEGVLASLPPSSPPSSPPSPPPSPSPSPPPSPPLPPVSLGAPCLDQSVLVTTTTEPLQLHVNGETTPFSVRDMTYTFEFGIERPMTIGTSPDDTNCVTWTETPESQFPIGPDGQQYYSGTWNVTFHSTCNSTSLWCRETAFQDGHPQFPCPDPLLHQFVWNPECIFASPTKEEDAPNVVMIAALGVLGVNAVVLCLLGLVLRKAWRARS